LAREAGYSTTQASRALGTAQSALGLKGCGREVYVLKTSSLQFAKAGSAATLSQQEKKHHGRCAAGQSYYYRHKTSPHSFEIQVNFVFTTEIRKAERGRTSRQAGTRQKHDFSL
jgi:hypothetical protein